jgi:hypothetical protein
MMDQERINHLEVEYVVQPQESSEYLRVAWAAGLLGCWVAWVARLIARTREFRFNN